jgi:acylphosphatase
VRGVVQGVGFIYFVLREASRLGLSGWVANRPDGSVEVCAEGPAADLAQFVDRVSAGPPGAAVADLDVQWAAATRDFVGFVIRSGAHSGD